MKINFYNREPSKIFYLYEAVSLPPILLLSDHVMYCSHAASAINNYLGVDNASDEMILEAFTIVFHDEEEALDTANKYLSNYPKYKKLKSIKHKDKTTQHLINTYKSVVTKCKNCLKLRFEDVLDVNHLLELVPFVEAGVFDILVLEYYQEKNKEDVFIKEIANTILERNSIFLFDENVDKIFNSAKLNSPENNECDFIKIPLWDFPPVIGLTFQQINYTRENIQPALSPFKTQLNELSEQLFNISFSKENLQQIKQLCTDKLSTLVEPVRKSIDESIYISQIKNSLQENIGVKFCLGITSAETLVNYYEKMEIILPYVTSEIKQQISRIIDLKASYLFCFFDIKQ